MLSKAIDTSYFLFSSIYAYQLCLSALTTRNYLHALSIYLWFTPSASVYRPDLAFLEPLDSKQEETGKQWWGTRQKVSNTGKDYSKERYSSSKISRKKRVLKIVIELFNNGLQFWSFENIKHNSEELKTRDKKIIYRWHENYLQQQAKNNILIKRTSWNEV